LIEVKDGRYGIDSGSLAIFAAMEGAEHMSNGSREPAVPPAKTERATAAAMTGCFAIFAAIRRASSRVQFGWCQVTKIESRRPYLTSEKICKLPSRGLSCHPRHFMAFNGQSARNFMRARAAFSFGWWRSDQPSTDRQCGVGYFGHYSPG
jgi:hypothetical protein